MSNNMLCKSNGIIFYNAYNQMKFSRWYFQENSLEDFVILVVGGFRSIIFRHHPSPFHEQLPSLLILHFWSSLSQSEL